MSEHAIELEPCVYCGLPADSKDHVIPRAYAATLYGINADRGKLLRAFGEKVPACRQCNSILGSAAILTVRERRRYVHDRLREKHARLLASPDWTEQELDELGPTLRSHVLARVQRKELLRDRLAWRGP